MFKKFFDLSSKLREKEKLCKELSQRLHEKEAHVCNPEAVVSFVLNRGVSWYDYEELDHQAQEEYYKKAQDLLDNPVFINEVKHITADLVQHVAKQSQDFNEVMYLRHTINGLHLLEERIKQIKNPNKKVSEEDLYSAI